MLSDYPRQPSVAPTSDPLRRRCRLHSCSRVHAHSKYDSPVRLTLSGGVASEEGSEIIVSSESAATSAATVCHDEVKAPSGQEIHLIICTGRRDEHQVHPLPC